MASREVDVKCFDRRLMKNPIFFTSDNGNRYFYSPYRRQILLCHPLISHFYHIEKSGTDISCWFKTIDPDHEFFIEGVGSFSFEEVRYQKKKYIFLKKHGFLTSVKPVNLGGRLSVSDVRKNIASVKQIIFEVTEDCNLNCTYCTYSKYYQNPERTNRYLAFKDVNYALANLIHQRTKSPLDQIIISFYGGEPLKNFPFIESVVAYTQSFPREHISFKYTMSSNGLLLKKYIHFLVKHAFELSISLDGNEEANAFRVTKNQRPSFHIVTENLDYVQQQFPDFFAKNISFLSVLHSRNDYLSVFNFFQDRYGKTPMMSEVNPMNLTPEHVKEFKNKIQPRPVCHHDEVESIRSMATQHPKAREMMNLAQFYSGFVFKNCFELISPKAISYTTRKRIPTATCIPFSLRVYFNAAGSIIPCEHISTIHTIGSYAQDRLDLDPAAIARQYNAYYEKISRLCNSCYFSDNCQDCLFNTGIEKEHPSCSFYTGETGFGKHLKSGISLVEEDFSFFLSVAQTFFHEE